SARSAGIALCAANALDATAALELDHDACSLSVVPKERVIRLAIGHGAQRRDRERRLAEVVIPDQGSHPREQGQRRVCVGAKVDQTNRADARLLIVLPARTGARLHHLSADRAVLTLRETNDVHEA